MCYEKIESKRGSDTLLMYMLTLFSVDYKILDFISNGLKNPIFDKIMPVLSNIDNHGEIWIAIALLIYFLGKTKESRFIAVSIILALAIGFIIGDIALKNIIARQRPITVPEGFNFLVKIPASYSFPSGHTTSSFAAFGVMYFRKHKYRYWTMALAIGIAFSRLYLHVHFPTDVLAGVVLGLLVAKLAIWLLRKAQKSASKEARQL